MILAAHPATPIAEAAAAHILAQVTGEARASAVIFVPTRRAVVTLRAALQASLNGAPSLLPRILPLAEIDTALLTLLGPRAIELLETIPAAMPEWQQRYLLTAQVAAFVRQRQGMVTLDYALALAEELMALQEQCARAGVALSYEKLRMLVANDMAIHWEESLAFLSIIAEHWPVIEDELGMITQAAREVRILEALAQVWSNTPPEFAVFAVGSTASQESTAQLLKVIADMPNGCVILPGIDPAIEEAEWASINPGHPLYHVKHFMDRFPVTPGELNALPPSSVRRAPRSLWLDALSATEEIPHWRAQKLAGYEHLRLIPCAHAESEARVIALLMREALETPAKHTALITPDEGLMTRVAAQMKRYGINIDRLERGTLAVSDTGSLWVTLLAAIREPERMIHLRSLLHYPLFAVDPHFLNLIEPYWYGVRARRVGQLPKLPETLRTQEAYLPLETLARGLAGLARGRMVASEWIGKCAALLAPFVPIAGTADEAVGDILETISEADVLGPIEVREFVSLLDERLAQPMRHGGIAAHPQLTMLTPVEARLQQFDRVILASMIEPVWPGITPPNAWLSLAAQQALGLPHPSHGISLMAHDLLMLGNSAEVFLTWPQRDQGSPTTRSRFVERLVTLLAMHGVAEAAITADHYSAWADALYKADEFAPSLPAKPLPPSDQRPRKLPVSALDTLFSDPFSVYARHVLGLKELDAIDADPEASDFGSLAHKAIQALTLHWNHHGRPASAEEMVAMADAALRDFADRPSTALFWRTRLVRALGFVDGIEEQRRQSPALQVQPEVTVEAGIALGASESITLHGRIDRLEEGEAGGVIADYKTGDIPSAKKILDGYATQLLAYAMLVDLEGSGAAVNAVHAIEYWRLPHGRYAGDIVQVLREELMAKELPEKLKTALALMLDETTPFLANPGRMGHEYDGISRYDEWAG